METHEDTLWKRWQEAHDVAARNALIVAYSPWARKVARDVFMRVPFISDAWHDCVQNAMIGLLEAVERFELDRGVSFQTYARYRVRGAVFNGLRHLREGMAQRAQSYDHTHAIHDRLESLDADGEPDALNAFVATTVGLGLGFLLESASFPGREDWTDAYAELEKAELANVVTESLPQLGEREQTILTLHYYHYMSFVDIAAQLGVTKGRISQLHKRALDQLRELISGRAASEY